MSSHQTGGLLFFGLCGMDFLQVASSRKAGAGRLLSGMVVGFALAFSMLLQQNASAANHSIVIGEVVDQHGNDLESSRDYLIGAKLYFDFVNSKGGINGWHLQQAVRDSGGDPAEALQLTRQLIAEDNALVLFGYTGEAAIRAVAGSGLLDKSGIALVSPLTGFGDDAGLQGHNLFVSRVPYAVELKKIFEYFHTVALSRFAVIATREDLASRLMPQLAHLADDASSPPGSNPAASGIVFEATVLNPGMLDDALKRADAKNPQVLIVLGDGLDLGLVARSLASHHDALPVVGLSLANSRVVLQVAGEKDANGILLSQVVPNPLRGNMPITREHLAFMKRYLDEPPSHLTLEGFMAAKSLVEVLRDATGHGADRAAVLHALRSRPAMDVGGVMLGYSENDAPLTRVDLTMVRADGTLLN